MLLPYRCVSVCVCVVIYYIHGGSQAPGGPIWSKVQGEDDDDDDELETCRKDEKTVHVFL